MLTDRRLSDPAGNPLAEDARKVMNLETRDGGIALLGYAGLGRTPGSLEPSEWMSAVLRGRNWPLVDCLNALAVAAKRELVPYLSRGLQGHQIIVPAFLDEKPVLFTIVVRRDGNKLGFQFSRITKDGTPEGRTPRVMVTGSGAEYLIKDKRWLRPLLRHVNAPERGVLSPQKVADCLAQLNVDVSNHTPTVGPDSIVVWRYRKQGRFGGGGGHQFYTGPERRSEGSGMIPTIGNGMDVAAISEMMMRHIMSQGDPFNAIVSDDFLREETAKLPYLPDERLR